MTDFDEVLDDMMRYVRTSVGRLPSPGTVTSQQELKAWLDDVQDAAGRKHFSNSFKEDLVTTDTAKEIIDHNREEGVSRPPLAYNAEIVKRWRKNPNSVNVKAADAGTRREIGRIRRERAAKATAQPGGNVVLRHRRGEQDLYVRTSFTKRTSKGLTIQTRNRSIITGRFVRLM